MSVIDEHPESAGDAQVLARKPRQCVLFLTDSDSPRILRHFDRLTAESPFPTFLCFPGTIDLQRDGVVLDYKSASTRFRFRGATHDLDQPRPFVPGTLDLLWLEAIKEILHRDAFEFFWILEFDVDFSGCWSVFFDAFLDNSSDLIATHIARRHSLSQAKWMWWKSFNPTNELTFDHHRKLFAPLVRLSLPLVTAVGDFYNSKQSRGHHEALLPTLCSYFGMVIEDIGGKSEFGRGMNWIGSNAQGPTFRVNRKGMPTSYFEEAPQGFDRPNVIWHPVKVAGSPVKVPPKGNEL
jgi:hypothetical protein